MKTENLIFIILIASILAIISVNGNLLPANILGNSQIEMQLGVENGEASSYWVLTTAEQKISSMDYISKTGGTQLAAGSSSESGEGVTTEGEAAKASIQTQYFYNLGSGTLGYTIPVYKDSTIPYVNSQNSEKSWLTSKLVTTKSTSGVPFYTIAAESWNYNADYTPSVTITKNGVPKTYTAHKITETGNLYVVEGTDPAIFFKENGIMSERNTDTPPSFFSQLAIIPYGDNKLFFMDTSTKTPDDVITAWNKGMTLNYADWNRNNKLDDVDKTLHNITIDDLVYEDKYKINPRPMIDAGVNYAETFKAYEYKSIADESKYTLVSDSQLAYNTDFVILGTWYIPIEYGNLTVIQHVTMPEITDVKLPNVYEGGTSRIEATIKNNGDTGKVTVRLIGDNTSHVTINDWQQNINIDAGKTATVFFDVTGTEVGQTEDTCLTIEAEGTTGEISTKTLCFYVIDKDNVEYQSSLQYVSITAVDTKGNLMPDFPITVTSQDSTQKGVWYGEVPVGELSVEGETKYGYTPKTTTITIEEGKEEYQFVYNELYTGSNNSSGDSDFYKYLAYSLIVIITIVLISGTFIYFKGNKKGSRRKRK